MYYSFIIPVYNRPEEVGELLHSLTTQTLKDFEVVIVEDGSTLTCEDACKPYTGILDLHYYDKPNSGPGSSRNYGAERAQGKYLIILDSDVVLPEGYLENIDKGLRDRLQTSLDASDGKPDKTAFFGGPDRAHPSFTPIQKAISYAMTSFFTTGGIRGGTASTKGKHRKALDKFYPRSFNMGIRADVYRQMGGFSDMRFGEDIDLSYRIVEAGYAPQLFPEAWVWHKRRTDLYKFWRQVFNSGIARIHLTKRHPGTLKAVHLLPSLFTLGVFFCLFLILAGILAGATICRHIDPPLGLFLCTLGLLPLLTYSLLIFADSATRNRSLRVGLLSVPAAFVQLMGYGSGFLQAWWRCHILRQGEFQAFRKTFYK